MTNEMKTMYLCYFLNGNKIQERLNYKVLGNRAYYKNKYIGRIKIKDTISCGDFSRRIYFFPKKICKSVTINFRIEK